MAQLHTTPLPYEFFVFILNVVSVADLLTYTLDEIAGYLNRFLSFLADRSSRISDHIDYLYHLQNPIKLA